MSEIGYREKCLSHARKQCDVCDVTDDIVVHHINGDRSNNALENLVPLCSDCHVHVHTRSYEHTGRLLELHEQLPMSSMLGRKSSRDWDSGSSDWASATIQMDEMGRATIPQSSRRALGLDGMDAHLDLDILVLEREGGGDDE